MARDRSLDIELAVLGLNHRTAPLGVREKLAFGAQELPATLRALRASLDEAVLLSTCHRTELYLVSRGRRPRRALLEERLGRLRGVARDEFAAHTYFLRHRRAVEHLFRVSCGLDSVIIGESQVLGQVRGALQAAQAAGSAGPVLGTLFASALRLGRRARSATAIGRTAASISTAAVELARCVVDLESAHLVLVGAGKMGELAAKSLLKRGVGRFSVVGRTLERAQRLTLECGDAVSIERLADSIRQADVVITATNAPHPVVTAAMVAQVMRHRRRPLWFIDIAVPRDVHPSVAEIPGVTVYNVDDLEEVAAAGLAERQAEVPKVVRLVKEEAARFEAWCRERRSAPAVVALRQHFDRLRREELSRRLDRLDGLTAEQRQAVDALTVSILNKLLHHPTVGLRRMCADGGSEEVPHVLAELFGVVLPASPADGSAVDVPLPLPIDTNGPSAACSSPSPQTPNDTRDICGEVSASQPRKGEDGGRRVARRRNLR